jgi:hypothetical protein
MVLFSPRAIRFVFVLAPLVIVIVLFVVIGFAIFGSQDCWCYCHWRYKGRADQGRVQ